MSVEFKDYTREQMIKLMQTHVEEFDFDSFYSTEEMNYKSKQIPTAQNPAQLLN